MTDGLYIDTTTGGIPAVREWEGSGALAGEPVDLTTFAQWIELQPISTHIGPLELIANEMYRRHHGMQAGEIKGIVKDLRAMVRQ